VPHRCRSNGAPNRLPKGNFFYPSIDVQNFFRTNASQDLIGASYPLAMMPLIASHER
jgi:hypothetical protein